MAMQLPNYNAKNQTGIIYESKYYNRTVIATFDYTTFFTQAFRAALLFQLGCFCMVYYVIVEWVNRVSDIVR